MKNAAGAAVVKEIRNARFPKGLSLTAASTTADFSRVGPNRLAGCGHDYERHNVKGRLVLGRWERGPLLRVCRRSMVLSETPGSSLPGEVRLGFCRCRGQSMYKKLSEFLQRLNKKIIDFGNWRRFRRRSSELREICTVPIQTAPRASKRETAAADLPDPVEELPSVPLLASDRKAIWLGSAEIEAHKFFEAAYRAISAIPNVQSLSCAEIAFVLNKMEAAPPKTGSWDSRLVYHFTRHFTPLRPPFEAKP